MLHAAPLHTCNTRRRLLFYLEDEQKYSYESSSFLPGCPLAATSCDFASLQEVCLPFNTILFEFGCRGVPKEALHMRSPCFLLESSLATPAIRESDDAMLRRSRMYLRRMMVPVPSIDIRQVFTLYAAMQSSVCHKSPMMVCQCWMT